MDFGGKLIPVSQSFKTMTRSNTQTLKRRMSSLICCEKHKYDLFTALFLFPGAGEP